MPLLPPITTTVCPNSSGLDFSMKWSSFDCAHVPGVAGFISPSTVGISSETVGWMGTARM
jgi:hypothetical protein